MTEKTSKAMHIRYYIGRLKNAFLIALHVFADLFVVTLRGAKKSYVGSHENVSIGFRYGLFFCVVIARGC
jgi:hypothetical protein